MSRAFLRRIPHDWVIFAYALLAGAPAVGVAFYFLWRSGNAGEARWILSLVILAC